MRYFAMAGILILMVATAAAVDVPFRDGSVMQAASYTVNGSYIMLEMEGGGRVAYDVADIDLEALHEAEAAVLAEQPVEPEEPTATLGVVGPLRVPDESSEAAGLTITDQHVKHVSGSGIAGPEDEEEEGPADQGLPEGFEEGGNVLLNNVAVAPLEGGQWQVTGEVVNRTREAVLDVRANLQATVPEGDPWTASVGVSGALAPDEKATFTHTFAPPSEAAEGWTPNVQVSVVWMKSETRLEPDYNRTAPHPSALPLDRGGVGGADTRNDDLEFD